MTLVMKRCLAAAALIFIFARSSLAQVAADLRPGVRVRVWLPDEQRQRDTPWRRQLLRGTVTGGDANTLQLTVPGTSGMLTVSRADISRIDVSRGTSRAASAFERALGGAVVGAISAALRNDPAGSKWPNYGRDWRAAEEGAKWGAAFGAVIGFTFPSERWRQIRR